MSSGLYVSNRNLPLVPAPHATTTVPDHVNIEGAGTQCYRGGKAQVKYIDNFLSGGDFLHLPDPAAVPSYIPTNSDLPLNSDCWKWTCFLSS